MRTCYITVDVNKVDMLADRQTDSDKPLSQEEKMREAKNKDPAAEDEDTQNIDWESCEITQGYEKKEKDRRANSQTQNWEKKQHAR